MAPISKQLSQALDFLNNQIASAEAKLSKLPGSGSASAQISFNIKDQVGEYLEFCAERKSIVWQIFDHSNDSIKEEHLMNELPIALRVAVAKRIPELLELAVAAEKELIDEAISAGEAIEIGMIAVDSERAILGRK